MFFISIILFVVRDDAALITLCCYNRLMRKEDRESSPLHIFSSHFYTTLSEEGTEAVESWTARKSIDIFKKRFIFLPINKSLHWSLCVVVNPGNILNASRENDIDSEGGTGPFPCILFLDSLKAHRKDVVARHVRKWLNAEWKRLMAPQHGGEDPFNLSTMAVFTPRSKFISMPLFPCRYRNHYCPLTCFQYPIRTTAGIVGYLSAATPTHSSCYVTTW